jgi:hypothetical protein
MPLKGGAAMKALLLLAVLLVGNLCRADEIVPSKHPPAYQDLIQLTPYRPPVRVIVIVTEDGVKQIVLPLPRPLYEV